MPLAFDRERVSKLVRIGKEGIHTGQLAPQEAPAGAGPRRSSDDRLDNNGHTKSRRLALFLHAGSSFQVCGQNGSTGNEDLPMYTTPVVFFLFPPPP